MNLTNEKLVKLFQIIQRETDYQFIYNDEDLADAPLIQVHAVEKSVEYILNESFRNTGLRYRLRNNTIVVSKQIVPVQREITGRVTNEQGEPLEGVTISLKGRSIATTSDAEGYYRLMLPTADTGSLVFTIVGYETFEAPLSSVSVINVSLKEQVSDLGEVVVVGYGVQRRQDLTGSVSSVGIDKIRDLAATRVDQALLGKASGVHVKPVSGEPGAAPKIRIRGIGSISAGSDPLYVIDGFPTSNIDNLNPNDIESMDILKDASATAIYGSRGANGVVLINTKRGSEGRTSISFDTYFGFQRLEKKPVYMNAMESAIYSYYGIKNQNIDEGNDVSGLPETWPIKVPQVSLDVLDGRNTNDYEALDEILQTAPMQQYQLSATGGNQSIRYAISGEYLDQEGIVINNDFKRYSLRANFDAQLSKRLTVKLNLNPSFTHRDLVPAGGPNSTVEDRSAVGGALHVHNFYPLLVDENGNYDKNGEYFLFSGLEAQGNFPNPLAVAREIQSSRKGISFLGNINAEYLITDNLKFNTLFGGNLINFKQAYFEPMNSAFFNVPASGRDDTSMGINWITENTLNYRKAFNRHNIEGLVGFTAQHDQLETNFLFSNQFPNNLVPTLSATSGIITDGSSDISEWSMLSYLARANYNFNNKYYVTASIRTDGSSRFGQEKKWGVFPSAALAWRISDENFMEPIQFISDMKLRASFGITGNNNIGNYEHQGTINYLKYPFGGQEISGYAPERIANPLLTWETQRQFNFGADLAVFNSRLQLTVDYFNSRNYNLLLNTRIPATTGFNNKLLNIGEVKNTGLEFTVNSINIDGPFEWMTDFNISTYRNEVVKLGPNGDPIYAGGSITMIGQPIGMYFGWLTDGIFMNQAELDQGPIYNPGARDASRMGDIRFKDVSGPNGVPDGIIDVNDKTIMGSPYPDFFYGMTNRFSYKNISLSISLQGSYGSEILAISRVSSANTRARYRQLAFLNDFWKSAEEPGDGKTPRPNNAPTGNYRGTYSQQWLDNASYLRINNITLSYVIPDRLYKRFNINALRVYLTANSPFIFTKYTGFNPDVDFSGNTLEPGVDQNDYPTAKSLLLGINLTF
ncbi:TonB-dependent receptor [Parapedobacter koreensis]|uniref:TonB-dependent receptor n=1 Tax=Parapedobacter koreensis TaxID=332977 RepID=UPI001C435AD8|nr:TonB-dependent receptor [Parapedobacter koreensis]